MRGPVLVGSGHACPQGRPARRAAPATWRPASPGSGPSWRSRGVPARRAGRRGGRRGRGVGSPTWTAPTSSWSPSTRRGRATSTRPCTSPGRVTGSSVSYAIADVAAFVTAGRPGRPRGAPAGHDPLRARPARPRCTRRRSARARPACCPTRCGRRCSGRSTLDAHGRMTDAEVVRARVRSREQLDYDQAQAEIDGGSPRQLPRPAGRGGAAGASSASASAAG